MTIEQIDLHTLVQKGKKLILLDVDNTITHWRSDEFSEQVLNWLTAAKQLGFKLAFVSNTRHPERLQRFSQILDIEIARGRMKPSRSMFRSALEKTNLRPEQAVMIGDQLMTDILGANRAGIDAIWLLPLSEHEFVLTKINRWIEAKVAVNLFNALERPIDDTIITPQFVKQTTPASKWHPIILQFIKFCVVGALSTVITLVLSVLLLKHISVNGQLISQSLGFWLQNNFPQYFAQHVDPVKSSSPIMYGVANFAAMLNSFFWNRAWTFQIRGKEERLSQLKKFYVVSIIAWVLNSIIAGWILNQFSVSSSKNIILSQLFASAIVMFVNFGGQRLYAFKPKNKPQ